MKNKLYLFIIINILRKSYAVDTSIREKQIKTLEKEKNDLYKKINEAIDDSVNTLKVNNDTDSLLTVNNLKDLKKQINELNNTETVVRFSKDANDKELKEEDLKMKTTNISDIRRYNLGALSSSKNSQLILDLEEVSQLLKKKGFGGKFKESEKINDSELQAKLEAWIQQRKNEKAKIKAYKQQKALRYNYEKCPRFGSKDKAGNKKSKHMKYPCCRKCCKKSYLGCL